MRTRLLVSLILAAALHAQGVRLTSRWSADTVLVGEPVILRLEVQLPEGSVPHFPELTPTDPNASLVQTRLEPLAVEYVFTFWELGRVALPGIPVRIVSPDGSERIVPTDSLSIIVVSALSGDEQDIRGIKSMVLVKLTDLRSVWIRAGLMVLLVGTIVLIWRSRRQPGLVKPEGGERLQPEVAAREQLDRLKAARYEPKRAWEYYLELSRILRQYLEQRFLFRALGMTTSEIRGVLPGELDDPATASLIGEVLEQSDLAKFAGLPQSEEQWRRDLDRVARIIDLTRPVFMV